MVKTEQNSEMCVRHYSDVGLKLRQIETGMIFPDAVDVIPCQYTYEETDIPLDDDELDDSDALRIITGGGV